MKNLIVFDSKYGTTQRMAELMAMIVGDCKITSVEQFSLEDIDCDYLICGSPIFNGRITDEMVLFLKTNWSWVQDKPTFFFVVNLEGQAGEKYLLPIKKLMRESLLLSRSLGGYLALNGLDVTDYESIQVFCDHIGLPFQNMNQYDLTSVITFAKDVKDMIDKRRPKLNNKLVISEIEHFLSTHSTCVLCTGYQAFVRATPIDYIYHKKTLYFITEGGLKYVSLLQNPNVSIGIHDPFMGMDNLDGMQITGKMTQVEMLSDEYFEILNIRDLDQNTWKQIPVEMYVFKVNMERIEFLHSGFKEYGGEAKQIISFY